MLRNIQLQQTGAQTPRGYVLSLKWFVSGFPSYLFFLLLFLLVSSLPVDYILTSLMLDTVRPRGKLHVLFFLLWLQSSLVLYFKGPWPSSTWHGSQCRQYDVHFPSVNLSVSHIMTHWQEGSRSWLRKPWRQLTWASGRSHSGFIAGKPAWDRNRPSECGWQLCNLICWEGWQWDSIYPRCMNWFL